MRADHNMAFLLKYENVAWYENGQVRILDRRVYPMRTEFVTCKDYKDVAACIKAMVTQSGGPYIAAAMGMVLAAKQAVEQGGDIKAYLDQAAYDLSHARPTTVLKMAPITEEIRDRLFKAIDGGASDQAIVDEAFEAALARVDSIYQRNLNFGKHLFDKVPDGGSIITHCYGESIMSGLLSVCRERGKQIRIYCDETRPYFQGARLTSSIASDMGFDTTVITDGMAACIMREKKIDLFTSGADMITMDGHVTNKIGTFQNAISCRYLGIPFYPAGNPTKKAANADDVVIEYRDESEVTDIFGTRIVLDGVKALYPAFDITPPELITGIVTDKGIYEPSQVYKYYE